MNYYRFSLCMSVYKNDNANDFITAFKSVTIKQTLKPNELVLVCDGPVPYNIEVAICGLQSEINIPMNVIRLPKNLGHAGARQAALDAAQYDYVAIMDSDDIAEPNRFEKQIAAIKVHHDVSVFGGQIKEFISDIKNVVGERIVPKDDINIKKYMKSRCPMNFVTVMMKKKDVMDVGGYIDWYCEEDYYLWVRLALKGYKFYNVDDNLVNVRVGKEMYRRRGGLLYFKSEAKLQWYMCQNGIIAFPRYIFNVCARFTVQVIMPNSVRGFVFKKLCRNK